MVEYFIKRMINRENLDLCKLNNEQIKGGYYGSRLRMWRNMSNV